MNPKHKFTFVLSALVFSVVPAIAESRHSTYVNCEQNMSPTSPEKVETLEEQRDYVKFCMNQQRATKLLGLIHQEIRPRFEKLSKSSQQAQAALLKEIPSYLQEVEELFAADARMLNDFIEQPQTIEAGTELEILADSMHYPDAEHTLYYKLYQAPKYRLAFSDYMELRDEIVAYGEPKPNWRDLIQGVLNSLPRESYQKAHP